MSIPKIIHHIWLGESPLHPLMESWRSRWISLHPTWKHFLWTEGSQPHLLTCNEHQIISSVPHLLYQACHLSQRSNIWRYEIIHRFGGLYIDTDIEPFKPVDNLLSPLDAFAVAGNRHGSLVYETAFFGASPNHPWTAALVKDIATKNPAISLSLGVDYFTQVTSKTSGITILAPTEILFPTPLNWNQGNPLATPSSDTTTPSSPQAYAIHHWSSLWFPNSFKPLPPSATASKPPADV